MNFTTHERQIITFQILNYDEKDLFLCIGVLVFLSACDSGKQSDGDDLIQKASFQIVKKAVKSELTNPATADFYCFPRTGKSLGRIHTDTREP